MKPVRLSIPYSILRLMDLWATELKRKYQAAKQHSEWNHFWQGFPKTGWNSILQIDGVLSFWHNTSKQPVKIQLQNQSNILKSKKTRDPSETGSYR